MTELIWLTVGVLLGWLTKIPFLLKWYKELKLHKQDMTRVIDNIDNNQLSRKVLDDIHYQWGENWDLVVDFFGQETADKMDEAVGYKQ